MLCFSICKRNSYEITSNITIKHQQSFLWNPQLNLRMPSHVHWVCQDSSSNIHLYPYYYHLKPHICASIPCSTPLSLYAYCSKRKQVNMQQHPHKTCNLHKNACQTTTVKIKIRKSGSQPAISWLLLLSSASTVAFVEHFWETCPQSLMLAL